MTAAVLLTEMERSDLRVAARLLASPMVGGPIGQQLAATLERIAGTPRFPKTYCSSCGGEFGPGDEGYAHCEDHQRAALDQPGYPYV